MKRFKIGMAVVFAICFFGTSFGQTKPSKAQAITGIKTALEKGLTSSINTLSAKDGFLGNAAVKILMPPEAQKVEKTLRSMGLGSVCDEFISSMNRAAESAVKEAAPVFVNALSKMTVNDVYDILLSGQQDAATTFFKSSTSASLNEKFSPIVNAALGQNNVNNYWNQLTTAYNKIPFSTSKLNTDLNAYVTQKAIDGLFIKVAEEELKIRSNFGGARSSSVLKSVFGWADKQK